DRRRRGSFRVPSRAFEPARLEGVDRRELPPGGRTVGRGAVRIAILAAAVVIGAIVISKGSFTLGQNVPVPSEAPSQSPTGPAPSTPRSTTPAPGLSPRQQGVKIAVYNATSVGGLASVTAVSLQKNGGYVVPKVGNFASSQ